MLRRLPSLNDCEGDRSRGFTFVGAKGPGEDLFVSFHDLRLAAQRRAAHYAAAGLRRGDRVATVVGRAGGGARLRAPLHPPGSLGQLDAFRDSLVGILNVATPRVLVTT